MPAVPGVPDVPDVPDVPGEPDVPAVLGVPGVLGVSAVPGELGRLIAHVLSGVWAARTPGLRVDPRLDPRLGCAWLRALVTPGSARR